MVTPLTIDPKELPISNWIDRIFRSEGFRLCRRLMAGLMLALIGAASPAASLPLRFGITPAVMPDQGGALAELGNYLSSRLGRPVEMVSRDRYADTLEMLPQHELDVAWLSDYPYILVRNQVRLVAVPLYQGRPRYRAYLIVPASDQTSRSLLDLRGSIFAYSDPNSHTGYLIPRHELAQAGERPVSFFRKAFFTWGHRNSIEAVAQGLAQAAYVDAYVWDSLQKIAPEITGRTRIVSRSIDYAFPPIVAHHALPEPDFKRLQQALLGMSSDPAGLALLRRLNLDGFIPGKPELYDPVEKMMRALGDK